MPEPTLLVSGSGLILAANQAVEQRLKIAVDGLAGRSLFDLVDDPPDEVARYLRLCSRTRSLMLGAMKLSRDGFPQIACRSEGTLLQPGTEGREAILMLRLISKESATVQFVALNQRIEEMAGEVRRRKRAEEEARRQEEALRVTLFSIGDGVISTDAECHVVMMNPVAEKLTGWLQDEAGGRPLDTIFRTVNEESRTPVENPAARALRDGIIVGPSHQTLLIARDGSERPIDDTAAPIRDSTDRLVGSVLVFRDILRSRKAERELQETKRRFQAVFNQQFQFMAILTADGTVLEANRTSFQLTGVPREQVLGRPLWETPWWDQLPAMREQWKRHVAEAARGEGPVTGEMEYSLADGTIRHATAVVTGLTDESGRITGILLEGHDDTERRRGEAILVAQKKVLELLVSGEPLPDVLDAICEVIEGDSPHRIIATVLLLDEDGQRLRSVAGRRAPSEYSEAIDGVVIGPAVGSCGTAAYRGEQIVVSDIATDPLWADFRDMALSHELRACWSTPVFSSQGEVLGTFAVYYPTPREPSDDELRLVDILTRTAGVAIERRRGEEAVRFQAHLLDTVGQAAIVTHLDGEIIYWNRFAETLYGWSRDEVLGRKISDIGVAAAAAAAQAVQIMEQLRTGKNWSGEFEALRRDGTSFDAFVTDTPLLDEHGAVSAIVSISVDISERKQLERSLRFLADASAALAGLVDFENTLQKVAALAVPHFADWCAVDIAEPDGTLRRLAVAHVDEVRVRRAQELHERYPPRQDNDFGVYNVLRTGRSEMMEELPDALLEEAATDEEHLRILRELGLKSYMCVPLRARGKVLGVVTFVTAESCRCYTEADLAFADELARRSAIAIENSQLYQELRDADRRKDEFLATLAHELRNPLAPIRNGLQILRLAGPQDDIDEVRLMMERQLNQLVRLVDDLLDVSRITRNKLELRKRRIELKEVVQSAIDTSRSLMEQAGHAFSWTLPSTPVYLEADLTRLAQVFSNLLNNSAKYTPAGGAVSLVAEATEDEVIVKVRDNGIGIPAESLHSIFEVFSQVDRNMERSQGGLGIGLTLVRRLIEMHGGSVEVSSDGPGLGSEFTVRLPIPGKELSEPLQPVSVNKFRSKPRRRILVVDDNQDSANSLSMMLRLMQHEIRTVHDGLAAMKTAAEFRPEIILLDIGMPQINGYEVCRHIREQPWSDGIVIVALTGWGQNEDRRRSAEAGFDHHLVKPVDLSVLDRLLTAPVARSADPEATEQDGDSLRVLVVDDRRDATFMLGTLLRKLGHDVRTASDGPAALELALEFRPDAVILDINMPGMSGIEVAEKLRRQTGFERVVLIAMTGCGEEEDRQRSMEAGFDHHLVKPADIRVVQNILATVKSNAG
ncbi:MAG: PAS domain S-box protein [Fuerstiella sp.]